MGWNSFKEFYTYGRYLGQLLRLHLGCPHWYKSALVLVLALLLIPTSCLYVPMWLEGIQIAWDTIAIPQKTH